MQLLELRKYLEGKMSYLCLKESFRRGVLGVGERESPVTQGYGASLFTIEQMFLNA